MKIRRDFVTECGYIPDYVVDKLREISNYSCNHMG